MAIYKSKEATKDGRQYFFQVYYTDAYGNKKLHKSKKYALKKDVQEAERIFLLSQSEKIDENNITIHELILAYCEHQKDKVKVTTYSNYKKYNDKLEIIGKVKLKELSLATYNKWKLEINKSNYSTVYKNNVYKYFRSLLTYAIKYMGYNSLYDLLNKIDGFTNPNELKKEMQFYTYEEFKKFISVEDDIRFKSYFDTLYYNGLRKGEANALSWKDIDFDKKTININKSVALKLTGIDYKLLPPKTKSSIRVLPMPEVVYNDLLKLKDYYSKFDNFKQDWFVFGGIFPLPDTTVDKRKSKNAALAEIKEIRIHDFRHSCASLLINKGCTVALVSKYLGHANISTTMNTYIHMFKNEFDDVINSINNLERE